ncbi:jg10570 [Pararge aegeria aegeria]|uniref:Jg10570 protein n=1 Tax=Pararge aegeria aegeria TaxID=348720 RepID=A0A8S4R9R8_9NEOP|nr:jg10570 [Pararge aegeria aegeria]
MGSGRTVHPTGGWACRLPLITGLINVSMMMANVRPKLTDPVDKDRPLYVHTAIDLTHKRRVCGTHRHKAAEIPTKTQRCSYSSPGDWDTGTLAQSSASQPAASAEADPPQGDLLKVSKLRQRRTRNIRCTSRLKGHEYAW